MTVSLACDEHINQSLSKLYMYDCNDSKCKQKLLSCSIRYIQEKEKLFFVKLLQKGKEVRVEDINSSVGVSFINHA